MPKLGEEIRPSTWRGLMLKRDAPPEAIALPHRERARDLADHPFAKLRNDACALRDRDEAARHPQPVPRMVPAKQCLRAAQLPSNQAHLRLKGEDELVALKRLGQRPLGVDPLFVFGGEAASNRQ